MPKNLPSSLGLEVFRTPAGEVAIAQIEDSLDAERIVFLRVDDVPVLIDMLRREMTSEDETESMPTRSGLTN